MFQPSDAGAFEFDWRKATARGVARRCALDDFDFDDVVRLVLHRDCAVEPAGFVEAPVDVAKDVGDGNGDAGGVEDGVDGAEGGGDADEDGVGGRLRGHFRDGCQNAYCTGNADHPLLHETEAG